MKDLMMLGTVQVLLKVTMLITICIVLSSCIQWEGEQTAAVPLTTLTAYSATTNTLAQTLPSVTITVAPTPTLPLTTTPTPTPRPTVPLTEPSFGSPPGGTILVLQHKEVFIPLAEEEYYYRPAYGFFDSVVWAIPPEGPPYKWVNDGRSKLQLEASPDGTMIAYIISGKNGEYTSVWMAKADGSDPQQLTPNYPKEEYIPRYVDLVGWSADSKRIAYRVDVAKSVEGQLYIIDVSSKQATKMGVEPVESAMWLPKSSHLMLISDGSRNESVVDIDTQEVGPPKFRPLGVIWGSLPDGKRSYELAAGVLKVFASEGSVLYQVDLRYNPASSSDFTWSPNGKWFIFTEIDRREKKHVYNVYKLSQENPIPLLVLEGSQISMTNHPQLGNRPNIELFPVWSPDGKWFAVFNLFGKGGKGELYLINVETNELRKVMTI